MTAGFASPERCGPGELLPVFTELSSHQEQTDREKIICLQHISTEIRQYRDNFPRSRKVPLAESLHLQRDNGYWRETGTAYFIGRCDFPDTEYEEAAVFKVFFDHYSARVRM